jgi:GTPase SAR1 family protein
MQKDTSILSEAQLAQYCKENGFLCCFETSAKENKNVEEAAKALVKKVAQKREEGMSVCLHCMLR